MFQEESTATSLALKRHAFAHTGSVVYFLYTFIYPKFHLTHRCKPIFGVMTFCPDTSSIRLTLKRFPLSDPFPCHARSEDVIVLHINIFPELAQLMSAASANTYLSITMKLLATCAKSVSPKSIKTLYNFLRGTQLLFNKCFLNSFFRYFVFWVPVHLHLWLRPAQLCPPNPSE